MTQYLSLLSSIDSRLQQQIFALAEADILPSESGPREYQADLHSSRGARATPNPLLPKLADSKSDSASGSGLGTLDVGWLNSRNDNVGKEMEAELWAKALDLSTILGEAQENEEV